MTTEQLSLIFSAVNSTILVLLFGYLKFGIEKRLKKYEFAIGDAGDLNRKMHDRMVEVEEHITNLRPITKDLKKRLSMTSSRLDKYNPNIPEDVNELIKIWNEGFASNDYNAGAIITGVNDRTTKALALIKKIKSEVDRLLK